MKENNVQTRILSLENGAFMKRDTEPRNFDIGRPSVCLVQKVFVWVIGGFGRDPLRPDAKPGSAGYLGDRV